MKRQPHHSAKAPAAIGPYSQAIERDGWLYLSGQTPIDPATGQLVGGDIGAQTQRAFDNLTEVLRAAGYTLDDVVKVNVYLTSMSDFAAMNAVYATLFKEPYPARTTVAVKELPLGARVEIELVARKG